MRIASARLRTLRSDLIDPILAVYHGRVVKRTGDGALVEFRSVVDAVRCAASATRRSRPEDCPPRAVSVNTSRV
jgi:class 3 adenylate cyclase